ncbi:MAG: amidase [Solirubrobacterales bacterium]
MSEPSADASPEPIEEDAVFAGLRAQAARLADGSTTSRELTELSLSRIDATEPTINAFRIVLHERALAAADEADRRLAAGERAPLLGVPIAIKDEMDIAGETTMFGCAGDFKPAKRDGAVAQRLAEAGAVIVGKTTTCEIGQWSVTAGPAFGVTRSPWNLEHTPGGSSGGSAAAVAAGLVAAAVGSDGAGSVRIPAAWSNLVGIKPQRGRVSSFPDREAFNGITAIGPLARTVGDAAFLLDVLKGAFADDLFTPPAAPEPYIDYAARDPGRLRVALSFRIPFSGAPAKLDSRVRARVEKLAEVLTGLGHDVVSADPDYKLIGANFLPRSTAGVHAWTKRVPNPELLDPRTIHNAQIGGLLDGAILKLARTTETIWRRHISQIFKTFDVVMTPTTAQPPLAADAINGLDSWSTDKVIIGSCPYAWPWNALGWPGVNVPAGFVEGLPVGAQLLGPANSEPRLISLAAQLESVERWDQQRPPVAAAVHGV